MFGYLSDRQLLKQDRQCTYNVTMRCVRVTTVYMICSECVSVALVTRNAKRIRHIIFNICGMFGCTIFFHVIS